LSTGRSDPQSITIAGAAWPLIVRRSAAARRYRLSISQARGAVQLSMPQRARLDKALDWARGHEGWLARQLAALPPALALGPGSILPIEGVETPIVHDDRGPRKPRREGDALIVGGPEDQVGARVLRWLREEAKAVLAAETRALAAAHGLALTGVAIGDPRSRWGSCSASGAIRYSWRLILAPAWVRQATVAHEVAHLRHLDHSPAFHRFHAAICAHDPAAARAWLRHHGAALHRIDCAAP
jgi:hypothetical protein